MEKKLSFSEVLKKYTMVIVLVLVVSGINTNKVYFLAYLNMGLLAAIAGMVTMACLNSANPQAGTSFEMDAIGSCFINKSFRLSWAENHCL